MKWSLFDHSPDSGRWISLLTIGFFCIVFQGCVSGMFHPILLSGDQTVLPSDTKAYDIMAGARLGLVDGQVTMRPERFIVGSFVTKLNDAGIFRHVNYPIAGNEAVLFEVGGYDPPQQAYDLKSVLKALLCGGTLFLACPHVSRDYEFTVNVRALSWPDGKEINPGTQRKERSVSDLVLPRRIIPTRRVCKRLWQPPIT